MQRTSKLIKSHQNEVAGKTHTLLDFIDLESWGVVIPVYPFIFDVEL